MTTPAQIPLLDLDLLRTVVAIFETGSFSAAADQVGRTPSAVSMQVKKIEETLGRPIFVRDSRSVSVTSDGAFLVEHARRMLAMNRDAMARFITPEVEGVVRLGAPDDVAERHLPYMLRSFAQSHPGITVNVKVDSTKCMLAELENGNLDLALITCEAGFKGGENAEVLFRERLVWAMLRGGCAAAEVPLPVSVWDETCAWRIAATEGLDKAQIPWRIAFQSWHISGQRAAILADLAVAPVPESSLYGDIIEAPSRFGLPTLPEYALGLLMADDAGPAVRAAADHVRAGFARSRREIGPAVLTAAE